MEVLGCSVLVPLSISIPEYNSRNLPPHPPSCRHAVEAVAVSRIEVATPGFSGYEWRVTFSSGGSKRLLSLGQNSLSAGAQVVCASVELGESFSLHGDFTIENGDGTTRVLSAESEGFSVVR